MTRDALIEAALELFAEKGIHGTSLEEIATAAGFSRGAIYSNFADKEALIFAVVDAYSVRLTESQIEVLEERPARADSTEQEAEALRSARLVIQLADKLRSFVLLDTELRLHALRNSEFAVRFRAQIEERRQRGAEIMTQQMSVFGRRTTLPERDLAVAAEVAQLGLSQLALIDPEQSDNYAEILALVFRLPVDHSEPIPGGRADD